MLFFITIAILFFAFFIYFYYKYSYTYWEMRGVVSLPPTFPFGNVKSAVLGRQNLADIQKHIYDTFKPMGYKYAGIYVFWRSALLLLDPSLVKNIFIKDFQHFHNRGLSCDESEPLSTNLISLSGPKWKTLRSKLAPMFTANKIKYMFQSFIECNEQMINLLEQRTNEGKEVDMKDIAARLTIDVIGSVAFGLNCNSIKNPHATFRLMGERALSQTIIDFLRVIVTRCFPIVTRTMKLGFFPSNVTSFFKQAVEETITFRENNKVTRKDFLQLLIELKNNGKDPADSLTMDEAAAQAFIFFLAGYDTTSATMSFALYELAVQKGIQKKARENVCEVLERHQDTLSYEAVSEMHYLDKIISETLRKYPHVPFHLRKCTKQYRIPDTSVVIEKGKSVVIPILAFQRDPEYFPDPDVFDPERFNDDRKATIKDYTYIPFGEGPRICVGTRFSSAQLKVALAMILKKFKFSLSSRTQSPLVMETRSFFLVIKDGLWLKFEKLN